MSLLDNLQFIATHPLNKDRPINALTRFLKWQLASRIFPNPIVYDWIEKSKLIIHPGDTGLTGNMYCELWEFSDMAYLLHVITPEDLFIDVGANAGSYTILACAVKGAKGYCFEPIPSTYERLMGNIRINNLSENVIALNLGLSDREDELVFTSDENCTNHVLIEGDASVNSISVKVMPLDMIVQGKNPSIMKIDVEGFETLVLRGSCETLKNKSLHSVIVELNDSGKRYGFHDEEILKTMHDYGFSTYSYEPFLRKLNPLNGKNNLSGNTLFIRDEDLVKNKIKDSPLIILNNIQI